MIVDIINKEKQKTGEFQIDDKVLENKFKDDLIHNVILTYQNNIHTNSANTLTRDEVAGGGKKPWRQKHTGRARHGSIRSPIWKGGGVVFGPRAVKKRISINKSDSKKALKVLFAKKLKNNDVLILENFEIAQPKTKEIAVLIKKLDLIGKKVLIITYKKDDKFYRAGRNIRNLKILQSKDVNGYEFLVNDKILFSKESIQDILRRIN
ncbi:MAG: 50S ribosomal protein L4 [Candidatus Goldbacteria bacterium]|nr:50S ribosomal protein L4 [Candidatus Goldiibacteriota bacterium]HPD18960.1 50S ribosomal protein L4 [Candidatus Goldiibacteriota bacterium]